MLQIHLEKRIMVITLDIYLELKEERSLTKNSI
nr:MAG TPA: hypothetical protein [Crassvirales sp.]